MFDATEIIRCQAGSRGAFQRAPRRWLILLSLFLASWQVMAGVRATQALSHPCCETLCDQAMPCAHASCAVCADRALEAPSTPMGALPSMDVCPSGEGLVAQPIRSDDIWKPPR